MKVYLALYDPSQPSEDGSFWAWKSSYLDRKLLDRVYYDFACKKRPENPNLLVESDIVGGAASLDPNWIFAYRFGNGGRDTHGRPERFVMMVAGLQIDPPKTVNLQPLITHKAFTEVLSKAHYTCPIPCPINLELDWEVSQLEIPTLLTPLRLGSTEGWNNNPFVVSVSETLGKLEDSSRSLVATRAVIAMAKAPDNSLPNDQKTTNSINNQNGTKPITNKTTYNQKIVILIRMILSSTGYLLSIIKLIYFYLFFKPLFFTIKKILKNKNTNENKQIQPGV